MEEKNLIRRQALETFFKRFPIIMLMMAIYVAITTTFRFIFNSIGGAESVSTIKYIVSLVGVYLIFQLSYGLIRTLVKINNNEKVTNLAEFLLDAKSRFIAPLYCILRILVVAIVYILVVSIIGSVAIIIAKSIMPNNEQLIASLTSFTGIVALFVTIVKVIPYEFSFFILAEDNDKSISGKDAIKQSKALLKDHVIDYFLLLLPIVGVFVIIVLLITLLNHFIGFLNNVTVFYGLTTVLEAFFTPIVRLVEINYYNILNDGNIPEDK